MLPSISGVLGTDKAAHLLRRATFTPTQENIGLFAQKTVEQAISELLLVSDLPAPPTQVLNYEDDREAFKIFQGWTLEQMRISGTSCRERMTYFYHTFLPADYTIIRNTKAITYQNLLYRFYALGSYKQLFEKVCADNAMLVYIDNTLNDKDAPNENFAREMFELYSIGKGPQIGPSDYTNYTEQDIKEAARVLTGLRHDPSFSEIDEDTLLPRGYFKLDNNQTASRHDSGEKVFSDKFAGRVIKPLREDGESGNATEEQAWGELSNLIEMIFEQDETAKFICRKLYRFFCYYKITDVVEATIISSLANTLRTNDYDVTFVLKELFASQHFYDQDDLAAKNGVMGALIKSPIEVIIDTVNAVGVNIAADKLDLIYPEFVSWLELQGMNYYSPVDVAGYPPYHQTPAFARNWIYPNSLARRYEFAALLVEGLKDKDENVILSFDTIAFVKSVTDDPGDGADMVRKLIKYLLVRPVPDTRFDYFLNDILLDNLSLTHWREEWDAYNTSSDDTTVRKQINSLVVGLLQSPEYQLF